MENISVCLLNMWETSLNFYIIARFLPIYG